MFTELLTESYFEFAALIAKQLKTALVITYSLASQNNWTTL